MSKVRIITDSNAYLPPEVLTRYDIEVIPHRLKVGGSFYEEDSDFTADDLFRTLSDAQQAGMTHRARSAGAAHQYVSGLLPGQPRRPADRRHPHEQPPEPDVGAGAQSRRDAQGPLHDSRARQPDYLFGLGLLVQMAAEAADSGADVNEIARIVNGAVPHLYATFFTESLGYLQRSANLSGSQSLLGTMLGIKAMLMIEDGRLVTQEKVQTREEVTEKLHEFVAEFATVREIGIMHHAYEAQRNDLIARLRETLPKVPVRKVDYPPSLATYIGPNTLGVVVYEGTY